MKNNLALLAIAAILCIGLSGASSAASAQSQSHTYYVSPTGADTNPGTSELPWHSFYHAAATLQSGDTAIFYDGTYNETQYRPYTAFASGNVTIQAEHSRQAILNFENVSNSNAIWIGDNNQSDARPNVAIIGMVLTKPKIGTSYNDGLVRCWVGSNDCTLIDDEFSNSYEPVKVSNNTGSLIENNLFDPANVHLGLFGAAGAIISNNTFDQPGDASVQTKGGTVDVGVYNNTFNGPIGGVAIYLGGASCGSACGVADVVNGYEGTRIHAAYNTITGPAGYGGIVFQGCLDCAAISNSITGVHTPTRTINNPGWPQPDGTIRYVPTVNPVII
jgi:hypothetical protein